MTAPIESCKKDAKMGKHIRYLWGVVECPWCWEASSASLKRNWLKCCKSPGAKVPDGKCQKRRSQQTTPLTSSQTLQETNFDRLPFYPRNRISRLGATGWQHAVQQKHYKMNYPDLSRVDLSIRKKVWYVPKNHWTLGAKVRWKPWWKRGAPRSKPLSGLPSGPLPREKIYARLLQARNGNQSLDQAIASELWRNLTDSLTIICGTIELRHGISMFVPLMSCPTCFIDWLLFLW